MASFTEDLATFIRSGLPIIYVQSVEEKRVEAAIAAVAQALNMGVVLWDAAQGFSLMDGQNIDPTGDPDRVPAIIDAAASRQIYVLRDYHLYLDDASPVNWIGIRSLRNLAKRLKAIEDRAKRRAIVIVAPKLTVPETLRDSIAVIPWSMPTQAELRESADKTISDTKDARLIESITPEQREAAARAALGLTMPEAQNAFVRSIVSTRTLDQGLIMREKKQVVARGGLLEWIEPDPRGLAAIGGLDNAKGWLVERERAFTPEAIAFGLPTPKGLLCIGVPGAGKSALAKAIAAAWGWPLIRLDLGRVFGGLVGQSEEQLRVALRTAEAASPCILWIDEIEKAFAGTGAGAADAGTSSRVFGSFLTWMQEKTAQVMVYATANDVSALPAELLRKGRFDEIFALDLPTTAERKAIWEIQIRKYKQEDLIDAGDTLAQASDLFTGAEIESALTAAMFRAFAARRKTKLSDIFQVLKETKPLAKTAPERIAAIREWAKTRARPASIPETASSEGRGMELD